MTWRPVDPDDFAPGMDVPGLARDTDVWDAFARWRSERRRFVLVTVVESRGFTPRKPGAHMLVGPDRSTVGTIGGGAIEQDALVQARALLDGGETAVMKKHLTQDLGMCCGGEMTLFLEVLAPAPRLFLYGAGYIAKPMAAIAAGCGFDVRVIDARPDWAAEARFPTSQVQVRDPEAHARELEVECDDYAVIVTHDHAVDQVLAQVLLKKPLRFLGMIGSIPKQRKFALRLRAKGFADKDIARLRTPLGLPIGASTPEEIAVSAMAEIVAFRRGHPVEASWTPPRREVEHPGAQAPARASRTVTDSNERAERK